MATYPYDMFQMRMQREYDVLTDWMRRSINQNEATMTTKKQLKDGMDALNARTHGILGRLDRLQAQTDTIGKNVSILRTDQVELKLRQGEAGPVNVNADNPYDSLRISQPRALNDIAQRLAKLETRPTIGAHDVLAKDKDGMRISIATLHQRLRNVERQAHPPIGQTDIHDRLARLEARASEISYPQHQLGLRVRRLEDDLMRLTAETAANHAQAQESIGKIMEALGGATWKAMNGPRRFITLLSTEHLRNILSFSGVQGDAHAGLREKIQREIDRRDRDLAFRKTRLTDATKRKPAKKGNIFTPGYLARVAKIEKAHAEAVKGIRKPKRNGKAKR